MMFDWLRTGKHKQDLPELGKKAKALLRGELRTRVYYRKGLADKAFGFILTGEGSEVLSAITAKSREPQATVNLLKNLVTSGLFLDTEPKQSIFALPDFDQPQLLLRLGLVWDADHSPHMNQLQVFPDLPSWFDRLLQEILRNIESRFDPDFVCAIRSTSLEEVLQLAEEEPSGLIAAFLAVPQETYSMMPDLQESMAQLPGLADSLGRHADLVHAALRDRRAVQRARALRALAAVDIDRSAYTEAIAEACRDKAKTVREAAEALVSAQPKHFLAPLSELCKTGSPAKRAQAITLCDRIYTAQIRPFFESLLQQETKPLVEQALRTALAGPEPVADRVVLDPPPLQDFGKGATLTGETIAALTAAAHAWNRGLQPMIATQSWLKGCRLSKATIRKLAETLQTFKPAKSRDSDWGLHVSRRHFNEFRKVFAREDVTLLHLIRFLFFSGLIANNDFSDSLYINSLAETFLNDFRAREPVTLNELAAAFAEMGYGEDIVARMHLITDWDGPHFNWEAEATWPYYATRLDTLVQCLEGNFKQVAPQGLYDADTVRRQAIRVADAFPCLPNELQPSLWKLALGPAKTHRRQAQNSLSRLPGVEDRIIASLTDSKQDVRTQAALWLSRLDSRAAIAPLRKVAAKEKSEIARGAQLTALEAMGEDVRSFLDRDKLFEDAEKGLRKGIPKQLEWFPFEQLPSVHWQDSGDPVPPSTLKWLIVTACKLKSPEPGPILRRHLGALRREDAEAFGFAILSAWLHQDTLPRYNRAEAVAEAASQAKQMIRWYKDTTLEALTQQITETLLVECLGSAIKEKGLLALVAATQPESAIDAAAGYLKKWYGHRLAQCKVLVTMLSWFEQPRAIQFLLSVANRFRTKGIQEEAHLRVAALAERQGWTPHQLADRTAPTAGFDDQGSLHLDYGGRGFICRLDGDLKPVLASEQGKTLKNLPAPGKSDDEDLAKKAKKQFSQAKKELKAVVKLQTERFYEALCTERVWDQEEWRTYLLGHPLLKHFCRRLIWQTTGVPSILFRPLDDGSFSDAEDDEIELPDDAAIQIAHGSRLDPANITAWRAHLADYQVTPLFDQLSRGRYELDDETALDTEIDTFEGYLLDSYGLRGAATKLGFARGQAEDGGCYYTYHKSFTGLGIEAVISFSGSFLPEENIKVALHNLYFTEITRRRDSHQPGLLIALGDIPPVLLAETHADLAAIAAKSDGYHADWQKQIWT